ncbi:DUF3348 domain-containing protein [[Pseudomonas] boreopolis]|uniref:DUF3348 domain-containing protein n=1 Tax=Xanthomonas boreopolis TaxID=86183 RepID=UPI003DA08917
MQLPRRTPFHGPTFIRLLAGLAETDVQPPRPLPAERLSEWLDINNAIALSAALDGRPLAGVAPPGDAGEDECACVRAALAEAIAADRAFDGNGAGVATDYAFFRQRYLALQQTMETGIGQARARLRERLAAQGPGPARLATVDAAMEKALTRRERTLLSRAPALLGQHFERLRQGAGLPDQTPPPEDAAAAAPVDWLDGFRKTMQDVLLAELDVRLQPVEGLQAALRTS